MSRFLYMQCVQCGIVYPRWARRWVDIRKVFCNAYGVRLGAGGLSTMLEVLGLSFNGRPHSGIDDARNIASVLNQLISDGCNIYENERLVLNSTATPADGDEDENDYAAAEVAVIQRGDNDDDNDDDLSMISSKLNIRPIVHLHSKHS